MTSDMRNDGMGAVTTADTAGMMAGFNVSEAETVQCLLCGGEINDGDRIYVNLENDRTMHYSHVGERVDYGVWLGTGVDLVGALIVDEGDQLGYLHPTMEADGFGLMFPGDAHYERLTNNPTLGGAR